MELYDIQSDKRRFVSILKRKTDQSSDTACGIERTGVKTEHNVDDNKTAIELTGAEEKGLTMDTNIEDVDVDKNGIELTGAEGKGLTMETLVDMYSTIKNSETKYKCPKCAKVFLDVSYFKRHIKFHHSQQVCHICMAKFCTCWDLQLLENGQTVFKCNICTSNSTSFEEKDDLIVHLTTHSDADKLFKYPIAGRKTSQKGAVNNYIVTDKSELNGRTHTQQHSYKCAECDISCNDHSSLAIHMNAHVRMCTKGIYRCNKCNKDLTTPTSLKQHMIRHSGEKLYQCSTCHKYFRSRSNLTKHTESGHMLKVSRDKMTVHKPMQGCPLCQIRNCACWDVHPLATRDTVFSCNRCIGNRTFKSRQDLFMHLNVHRAVDEQTTKHVLSAASNNQVISFTIKPILADLPIAQSQSDSQSDCQPHKCKVCFQSFSDQHHLHVHMTGHTSRYKCIMCEFSSNDPNSLIVHMGIHKLLECQVCLLKFSKRPDLDRHMTTHDTQ